jgi:cell wall-associated NlpC family hydrolase
MATPLRTSARRTTRRAGLAFAGTVGILFATVPASAAPGTSAEAARLVAERGHQLEIVTEDFNVARDELAAQQATAAGAAAELERATAALAQAQEAVRGIARSAYTGESLGPFQALLTSGSADEFVTRVATLQTIAGHQGAVLDQAAQANVAAAQAQVVAQQAATDAQATYDAVAGQQAELEAQIAGYRAQFEQLSAEERRAVLAAHHPVETSAAAEPSAEPERASRGEREAPEVTAPVVANGEAAQIAVDTALAQRGKPYVWAASGPRSFDCSGLVQYAYRAAGIALPHSSRNQASMGTQVSRDEARPGDLVAFYSPISHIGIYLGNGQMVHAPTSGDVVKVASVDGMGGTPRFNRIAG